MEWNLRTPLQWEWENVAFFNGKESEMSAFTSGGVISNGSMYSSVSGTSSGSDLGNGSSRSSVSASVGSSSKVGIQVSELNLESVECFPGNLHKNDELARGEDAKTSPAVIGSSGAAEPPIGLKLGKRTYFENFGAGNTKASSSAVSVAPAASVNTSWVSHQATQNAYCQVDGCNIDLIAAKGYHRRHRVCESHSKSPKVTIAGQERRFCQQCSRFHDLSEFDQKKRSCRKRLSEHNARRRKPQPETSFNFPRLSSSFFGADERQQMNFFLNRAPFCLTPSASTLWEESSSVFSLPTSKEPWPKPTKADIGLLHLPVIDFSNNFPASGHGFDEITPFKDTTAEVLSQGLQASVSASNLNGSPDLRRALSLLSKDSCGPSSTRQSNMIQFATTNPAASLHPPVQAASSTADCWQDEHSQQAVAFRFQVNASQFQELHLSKAPYESPLFEANQVFSKEFCYPVQFKAQDHPKSTF